MKKHFLAIAIGTFILVSALMFIMGRPQVAWKGPVIEKDVLPAMYTDTTRPGEAYLSLAYFPIAYRVVFDSPKGAVEVFLCQEEFEKTQEGQVYRRTFRDRTLRPYVRVRPDSVPANQVIYEGNTDADTELP